MSDSTMTWLTVLRRLVLFILAFAGASALVFIPLSTAFSDWADSTPMGAQLYADTAGLIAILAATWVMTRFVDHRPFVSIGFAPQKAARDLGAGLLLGSVWLAVSIGVLLALRWAAPQAATGYSWGLVATAAVSVLFNAITQQLILCGYVLQTLRARAGLPVALLVSALLFSALHAGAFQGAWLPAVNVFAAGLLFCLAYGVTGNLWLGIATHFAWNLLLGPVFGLTVSGTEALGLDWSMFAVDGPQLLTGGAFGIEGGLVVTITTTLIVAALTMIRFGQSRGRVDD